MNRSTVSKADIRKVFAELRAMGLTPTAVEILPGRVKIALADGTEVADVGELASELEKENLDHGRRNGRAGH